MNAMATPDVDTVDRRDGIGPSLPITVLDELENLLPSLMEDEKEELRKSIEKEGIRDSLLVWRTVDREGREMRILIDGHNRYRITESLGRALDDLPVSDIDFADMDEAKAWIVANQLMRRNLTDAQRSHFRGMAYEAAKKEGFKGNQHSKSGGGQNVHKQKTAEKLAKQFGVNEKTIRRDASFAKRLEAMPPEEKAAVLKGDKKLSKVKKGGKVDKTKQVDKTAGDDKTKEVNKPKPEEVPPSDLAPTQEATAVPSSTLTPDSVKEIVITDPRKASYLVFRAITKATEYFASIDSVDSAEHKRLSEGVNALRHLFDKMVNTLEEVSVLELEEPGGHGGIEPDSGFEDAEKCTVNMSDGDF